MILLFILVSITPSLLAQEPPWSISDASPVIGEERPNTFLKKSFWDNRFDYGYYFYEKMVSPADGSRCDLYPTCADYGYQAIQKHGPLIGGWMACDRLMRDHGQHVEHYSFISKFNKTRYHDSITDNDFWFSKHP